MQITVHIKLEDLIGLQYSQNDEFDYNMNNDLGRMVINPDVNVRSRGVMEKCSLCIQMTQKTILDAKKEGRRVKDGEFKTACSNHVMIMQWYLEILMIKKVKFLR